MQKKLKRNLSLGLFIVAVFLISGCSGLKTYPNTHKKNLSISTELKTSAFLGLGSVKASMHIYNVDSKCQTEYMGTVKLYGKKTEVGIPSGKTSFLSFSFDTSSFFGGTSGSVTNGTLLKPRKGNTYDITATYIDDIYNVEIFRIGKGRYKKQEVESRSLSECKAK